MEERKDVPDTGDYSVANSRNLWVTALRPLEWLPSGTILDHSRVRRSKTVTENGEVIRESRSTRAHMRYFLSRSEVSLSSRAGVMQSERLYIEMEYLIGEPRNAPYLRAGSDASERVDWVIDGAPVSIEVKSGVGHWNQFGEVQWTAEVELQQVISGDTADARTTIFGYTSAVRPLTWKTFPVDSMETLLDADRDRPVWPENYW